jgi:hypothetical protein
MQLDRALGATKLRPVVHRQAQIDRGRIETDQLVIETELAFTLRLRMTQRHALFWTRVGWIDKLMSAMMNYERMA